MSSEPLIAPGPDVLLTTKVVPRGSDLMLVLINEVLAMGRKGFSGEITGITIETDLSNPTGACTTEISIRGHV